MKKIFSFTAAIFFLIYPLTSFSQSLGISSGSVTNFPDTIAYSGSANFFLYVKNTGSVSYTGPLDINYSVNNQIQGLPMYSGPLTNLNPGDSALITVPNFIFNSPDFAFNAINIVVVWPVSLWPASDSATLDVFIQESYDTSSHITGYQGISIQAGLQLYPNPVSDVLVLSSGQKGVHEVVVFDALNRRIISGQSQVLDVSALNPGRYHLLVRFADGEQAILYFFKI